jgi:hypothetical protein
LVVRKYEITHVEFGAATLTVRRVAAVVLDGKMVLPAKRCYRTERCTPDTGTAKQLLIPR